MNSFERHKTTKFAITLSVVDFREKNERRLKLRYLRA